METENDLFGTFMASHKWYIRPEAISSSVQTIAEGVQFQVYEGVWRGMRVAVKRIELKRVRGTATDFDAMSATALGGPAMGMGLRRPSNRPRLLGGGHTALLQISTELSLIFSLHHPNLLLYIGAGADRNGLLLMSELMERGSLQTILMIKGERCVVFCCCEVTDNEGFFWFLVLLCWVLALIRWYFRVLLWFWFDCGLVVSFWLSSLGPTGTFVLA